MKPRCAILVRVSTVRQETDRQINDLKTIVASKGWNVIAVVEEEGVRGSAKVRPGLDQVIAMARAGEIDKVAVHEVSRVARKNSVAHQFIETLTDLKVSLYWHSQGVEMLLDNGTRNPAASLIFSLMSEIARNESDQLGQRIRSGLAEARRKGVVLGRAKESEEAFLAKYGHVVDLLRSGMSIRKIAAETGVNHVTVQKVKRKAT
jgi:DNA invertase Pin-like site-specific DNA recombinase